MFQKKYAYIIANFGGPRSLDEIRPFLTCLLTDPDVIRTKLPKPFQNYLFRRIAKKRAKKIQKDYKKIGGKSPIFQDTESVAFSLSQKIDSPVIAFHRYLLDTHPSFIAKINQLEVDEIRIFPMFPQFSYATTGSIARFFSRHFDEAILKKMRWIKSYPAHSYFVDNLQTKIKEVLSTHHLKEDETLLLFSAHGIPQEFVDTGDIYESECQLSFEAVMNKFPYALGKLAYQSKFGPKQWLTPYTEDLCKQMKEHAQGRKNIVIIPLSFTSDHIETLYEIEHLYMPILKELDYRIFRCPALNQDAKWIDSISEILKESNLMANQMLIRKPLKEKK